MHSLVKEAAVPMVFRRNGCIPGDTGHWQHDSRTAVQAEFEKFVLFRLSSRSWPIPSLTKQLAVLQ